MYSDAMQNLGELLSLAQTGNSRLTRSPESRLDMIASTSFLEKQDGDQATVRQFLFFFLMRKLLAQRSSICHECPESLPQSISFCGSGSNPIGPACLDYSNQQVLSLQRSSSNRLQSTFLCASLKLLAHLRQGKTPIKPLLEVPVQCNAG